MKKSIIIIFSLTILFGCNSQSKIDNTQLDYKDWSAQQKLVTAVTGSRPDIASVIAITDTIEVDGVKYVGLEVLYSKYLHWEYLGDLYFDDVSIRDVAPFDTAKFFETFEKEYGKIYGEENVERIEDNDYFGNCVPCKRMYVIKNIRLRMYGVLEQEESQYSKAKWSVRPDSKGIEIIPKSASSKPKNQEILNKRVPNKIQSYFTEEATYYSVTEFKGTINLEPENELHNTVGNYIKAINDGNGAEELNMTHPKIVNALRLEAENNNTISFLDSAGFLCQNGNLNQVAYISPIISSNGSEYTKLIIIGSFKADFSATEITPDMSYLFSILPEIYKEKYGQSNVNADNETKIISVKNVEFPIYAVNNKEIGGWKFSTIPYSTEGISSAKLWKDTIKKTDLSADWWAGQMERRKDQIDVIIPSDILLQLVSG